MTAKMIMAYFMDTLGVEVEEGWINEVLINTNGDYKVVIEMIESRLAELEVELDIENSPDIEEDYKHPDIDKDIYNNRETKIILPDKPVDDTGS